MIVRHAFTLIELLILLALTSVLVAILAPALAAGRDRAVAIECASNLRQVGQIHYAIGNERWGNSAYDFQDSDAPDENNLSGDDDRKNRLRENGGGGDPIRLKGQSDSVRSDSNAPFDLLLEAAAKRQPAIWSLVCPEAEEDQVNSFGITEFARLKGFDRVYGSDDMILGCSDLRVVIELRSYAFRHRNRTNLMFGDLHINAIALGEFSREMGGQMRGNDDY